MQRLDRPRAVVEHLLGGERRPPRLDRRDVPLGRAHVPPATAGQVRVGRAADPAVVALGPVEEVVAALVAGPGPIRDLVPRQPGRAEDSVGGQVLAGLVVVVGMASRIGGERRAGLDGEGVRADVRRWRVQREDGVERAPPVVGRLAGGAEDEVDVVGREPGAGGQGDRPAHVVDRVPPPERLEHGRHHRLHAEGQTGHAGRPVGGQQRRGDRVRVALDRHLGARHPLDLVEHGTQQLAGQQRRRAAAHEHRRGPRQAGAPHLGPARRRVRRHQVGAVGPRGERAVVAAGRAERHVHVHPEPIAHSRVHDPRNPQAMYSRRGGQADRRRPRSSRRRRMPSADRSNRQPMARTSSARMVSMRPLKSWRCTWIMPR